jgi:hypothetical protein
MYQADKSALGAIGFSFVMTHFLWMKFLFLILFKNRFTRSQWERIGSPSNSVDPHLNWYLNQFYFLLVLKTFWEQIQRSPLNLSSASEPPPINTLANLKSSPHSASFKFAKRTLDSISSPRLLLKLRMVESSNTDAAVFGLKVKLRPLLNSQSDYSDNWN